MTNFNRFNRNKTYAAVRYHNNEFIWEIRKKITQKNFEKTTNIAKKLSFFSIKMVQMTNFERFKQNQIYTAVRACHKELIWKIRKKVTEQFSRKLTTKCQKCQFWHINGRHLVKNENFQKQKKHPLKICFSLCVQNFRKIDPEIKL